MTTLKNRSRIEILYDIVSVAKSGAKKTHLMYKSNLSFSQLDLYLRFIIEEGLLEEKIIDETRIYLVTARGRKFLELFERLQETMSPSYSSPLSDRRSGVIEGVIS